eukprot:740734-Pyramimonas_sp.AAC.1
MILAGTQNDTRYESIVTQLRASRGDRDLRDRDKPAQQQGRGFGGRVFALESVEEMGDMCAAIR